jgi:hypothetical protein
MLIQKLYSWRKLKLEPERVVITCSALLSVARPFVIAVCGVSWLGFRSGKEQRKWGPLNERPIAHGSVVCAYRESVKESKKGK